MSWQFFQLPYAIVGISVITALLPRMSEHASARRYCLVRDDFSIGVRLASVIVVPAAIYLGVLPMPVSTAPDYIALSVLPRLDVVAGLGIAYGISNLVGAIVGWAALLRRVGSLDGRAIARSLTRMHVATVPGAIWAVAVTIGAAHVAHNPSVPY